MRGTFAKTLAAIAERDKRVVLLTGDLGYMALEPFRDAFPDRFFNAGVAEQNMVGMATGLAEAGLIPFVYSIVTFAVLRPYEFIRNGPVLHQLPVRVVGVGGGMEYGHNGPTHYGLEDVGVLRVQPGMGVVAPADFEQTRTALLATYDAPGPLYYRLGKDDVNALPGLDGRFEIGRGQMVREGAPGGVLFISMGSIALDVAKAAEQVEAAGVPCAMMVVASMNPAPVEDLAAAMAQAGVVVTAEAHYIVGGIGSLACEVAAERGLGGPVVRCGVRQTPDGTSGSQAHMHKKHGLSPEQLAATALKAHAASAAPTGAGRG